MGRKKKRRQKKKMTRRKQKDGAKGWRSFRGGLVIPVGEENGQRKRRESSRPVRYIFYFAANVRCIRRASGERKHENLRRRRYICYNYKLQNIQLQKRPDQSISHWRLTVEREYETRRKVKKERISERSSFRSLVKTRYRKTRFHDLLRDLWLKVHPPLSPCSIPITLNCRSSRLIRHAKRWGFTLVWGSLPFVT